jgi:hypothetical protein
MDFSERNKKVALARWGKVLARENASIPTTDDALRKKAALCGFLAGDGCVWKRHAANGVHHIIGFYPDDKVMLETYCNFFNELYQKLPNVRKEINYFEVRLTSRTAYEDLCKSASFGIHTWRPSLALFTVPQARELWLKAFFSAEAYVGKKAIKIQTVNKEGMRIVSQLLNDSRIGHGCYTYVPKKKNCSPVNIIMIVRKADRRAFQETIGFWHAKKTEALKKSLDL